MRDEIRDYFRKIDLKEQKSPADKTALFIRSIYRGIRDKIRKSDRPVISKFYLKTKSLERSILGRKFKFVTIDDLVIWTNEFVKKLPITFDVIVGIPRSGLLVANIIGLKLGKPVTTPDLFCKGVIWKSRLIDNAKYERVLLVDDTISTGDSIKEARDIIMKSAGKTKLYTAALIATKDSKGYVDYYHKVMELPRVFEWNLLHSKKGVLVSDLDGVICENCPEGMDEDESGYADWLKNAKPYLIPSFEIDVILSNRLEKYRGETQTWLFKNGVRYNKLILWDLRHKSGRNGRHAENKIKALLKIKPEMVWESSLWEAKVIWEKTKISTLCVDEMILFS